MTDMSKIPSSQEPRDWSEPTPTPEADLMRLRNNYAEDLEALHLGGKTLAQYPQVQPLFDLKAHIDKLRKCELKIGRDGFARASLHPFVAVTGRTQPPAREFIFLQPAWLRFLIVAPPGHAVASLDWSGQEIAVAAALSGDENLRACYATGDAHLAAGKLFGIIPEDGTGETYAAERNRVKPVMFGTNYGAGVPMLARTAGISEDEARKLRLLHKRTFPTFWKWIENVQIAAYRKGEIKTASGWTMRVPPETRATTLMDWPMQAAGGDMMRLAACDAIDARINLCCTVHDSFVLIAPAAEIEAKVARMREIMGAASQKTIGLVCEVHSDIFEHPKRFLDKKGAKMQAIVEQHLAELEGIEPPPPPPKRKPRATEPGDGKTLHPYVAKVINNAEARLKTDEDPARALFIGANEAVKRANGRALPNVDAVLARLEKSAINEGVEPPEAEKIVRKARQNREVVGIPTELGGKGDALFERGKISGRMVAAIRKGLIDG